LSNGDQPETNVMDRELAVYQCAQENAHHTDTVVWAVASINWTANAILLAYALKAVGKQEHAWSVAVVSAVGGVLTLFVWRIWNVLRDAKLASYEICQAIEDGFPEKLRMHQKIADKYPHGVGTYWVHGISIMFGVLWILLFLYAVRYFQCLCSRCG
jgi:hypothetical protein